MRKTVRTPFLATLRKAFKLALTAEKQQTSAAEVIGQAKATAMSRRRFLENTGKTALGGALAPGLLFPSSQSLLRPFLGGLAPKIVIVGGGIAGLNALHTLKKNKLDATIYEATGRTGGRMFTVQEAMGKGTWTEFGGEFIDTNHKDMWDLIGELDLEVIDYAQPSETALHTEAFFFEGQHRSLEETVEAFRSFAPRMAADMEKLDGDISYTSTDPFVKKLDNCSLSK